MSATKASILGENEPLELTPLHGLHLELGGKMVAFAGYDMPVQYPAGIMKEHLHTRAAAGLFDVSHMGQAVLFGPDHATTSAAVEALAPGNIKGLGRGRMRYTQLTTKDGGILDDLMVTRPIDEADDGQLILVVNAGCKSDDYAHIQAHLPDNVTLKIRDDLALMALQGPKAAACLARHCPGADDLVFMSATPSQFDGIPCSISRSGYTGEDGYEISVAADKAEAVARALLAEPEVEPIGLGARDSLRLEAGLCLYGHDIDTTTSPVEAGLVWSIGKRRREQGGFLGEARILAELKNAPTRKLVGLKPEGRAPAREGTEIHSQADAPVGHVTSGGFGPTVGGPVALGYVEAAHAEPGTKLHLQVRGKSHPAEVVTLPFVPNGYVRKKPKT